MADPGGTYYYNAATGETQWDRPEDDAGSSRSSAGEKLSAVQEAERIKEQAKLGAGLGLGLGLGLG